MTSSLSKNRSFLAFVVTQFLGAFNDNAFKQLVLLLAVDLSRDESGGSDQVIAMALFSAPFVLFSGFAGNLADRLPKTTVIRACKLAEVVIMGLGGLAFWMGNMPFLLAVVFLMGAQSAFFGPAKYGILPEMIPRSLLSKANAIVLMTTYVSIILGMAAAGLVKDVFPQELYKPQLIYVLLAVLGTWSALGVRRLPAAQPDLAVMRRPFGDLFSTLGEIRRDRAFLCVVVANSYFWFVGGTMQSVINVYGRKLMELTSFQTSCLLVSLSVGIALGSMVGGWRSRDTLRLRLTDSGMVILIASLLSLTWAHHHLELSYLVFFCLGVGGGLFALPLQTCVQIWPPESEKGRVVAAVNFANWVFIFLSAGVFKIAASVFGDDAQYMATSLAVLSAVVWVALRQRVIAAADGFERPSQPPERGTTKSQEPTDGA